MFGLFSKKAPTISSIQLPDFGWECVKDEPALRQWISPEGNMGLFLHFFEQKPDLPSLANKPALIQHYRELLTPIKGGILLAEIQKIQGIETIQTLFKIPQETAGMNYLASLTIPFAKYSYVIKIQAIETGVTGTRESALIPKLLMNNQIRNVKGVLEGWYCDPYDADSNSENAMNLAESPEYDDLFPDHPLTRTRKMIQKIQQTIAFGTEIQQLKPFSK